MATRNFVPRNDGEGSIGTTAKQWADIQAKEAHIGNRDISADGIKLDTHETSISTLQTKVTTLEHAYAGAKAAATVADMTDHNQIYVYVGSETGYTNGNWYYWNGTAWTSGGVYNATALETDKTLTISGAAADAKVVGDTFTETKDILSNISEHTRNLFSPYYIVRDVALDSSGKVILSNNCASIFFPCEANKTYVYKNFVRTGIIRQAFFTSKPNIGDTGSNAVNAYNTNTVSSTTNADSAYIVILIYNSSGETYTLNEVINACQIEQGATSTNYVAPFMGKDTKARSAIDVLDNSMSNVENKFEYAGNNYQIFNSQDYLKEDDLYVRSGGSIISYEGCLVLTTEINAHSGDSFVWQFFNDIEYGSGHPIVNITPFTTDTIPETGDTAIEYGWAGTADFFNKKGIAALTSDAKYFNVQIYFSSVAYKTQYAKKMADTFLLKYGADYSSEYCGYVLNVVQSIEKHTGAEANCWNGKKIWWCGTSIPEGRDTSIGTEGSGLSYPALVGQILGATVFNESLGASMCRANVRTGDYVKAKAANLLRAFTQTTEEKQYIINNWSTIRLLLNDPNTYKTLDATQQAAALGATFEERLMPYLDGTKPMPDLFVIDHGHNDWKSFYTMPDGTTPDTELKPTVENIANNVLAEDTYMTANNNAKLISFFTEISNIPSVKRAEFIASVNRNCFIGAVNFLCTLILSKNPRARILFIGNLDNWEKPQVQPAQEYIASSWNFHLIKMWEYLGFSGHYIPNTATYWDDEGTTDLTVKEIYCKDGVHPHSDETGEAIEIYAHTIANVLKNIR